jgi:hypothetical protein
LILLDTHVLLWAMTEPQRVSRPATSAIRKGRLGGGLGIAAITLWEITRLFSRGSLRARNRRGLDSGAAGFLRGHRAFIDADDRCARHSIPRRLSSRSCRPAYKCGRASRGHCIDHATRTDREKQTFENDLVKPIHEIPCVSRRTRALTKPYNAPPSLTPVVVIARLNVSLGRGAKH